MTQPKKIPLSPFQGGHDPNKPVEGEKGLLRTVLLITGVALGVVALPVVTVLMTSQVPAVRWGSLGALALLVIAFVMWRMRRRANRPSLDETLRSRRT